MKTQFVSAGGKILSTPRTTTGLVTAQPTTTQRNDLRGHSKPRRLLGPLLAAAAVLQAAVVLGGPPAYTFKPISFLGDPVPGGDKFVNDYEPSGINNRGQIAFTADLDPSKGDEGVFLGGGGTALRQVVRAGQVAPGTTGGEVFGPWELGNLGFIDEGDAAIPFSLDPFTHWLTWFNGYYGGVWRYSHVTQQVTPVMLPGDRVPGSKRGTFKGVGLDVSMNNQGTIAFEGILSVDPLTLGTDGPVNTMTAGLFVAGKHGTISAVVVPGGPAPNGDTWASAVNPSINEAGDMSFGALTVGAQADGQSESVYLRKAATGKILTIAHVGDPAPGGGELYICDRSKINDRGDVAFAGYLDPAGDTSGVYLYTEGTLVRVAGTGDAMPGDGNFVSGSGNVGLNNSGTVAFTAALDTGEEGFYAYSEGSLRLIAKTGTVIPGLGKVSGVTFSDNPLNDRGQTVFGCDLTDGRTVLLLATPTGAK